MNNHIEALSYYLGAFVDELTRLDVCDVVISPGSRSTPIAFTNGTTRRNEHIFTCR